jgi:hypothetical protein
MQSADDLRKEARRCLDAIKDTTEPDMKRKLATRSFELVHRAVALSPAISIAHEV